MKRKKETYRQRLRRKTIQYRLVKNYLGDTKEANKAYNLSEKTFNERYGLKLTKSKPKIRQYKPDTYKKHQKELSYFRDLTKEAKQDYEKSIQLLNKTAKEKNLKPVAVRLKKKELLQEKRRKIKQAMIRKRMPKEVQTGDIKIKPQKLSRVQYPKDKRDRRKLWGDWVRNKNMPLYIQQLVYRVNLRQGYDADANYGYAVVYEAIRQNLTIEEVEQYIQVDPFSKGDYYQFTARLN